MSYQTEQQRKRQCEEEERHRCHQSNLDTSSDRMKSLNPISRIDFGNGYGSSSNSGSCSGSYESGSSSDISGSCSSY